MFREVADIQTADMLKLPVPKVNYHNIKTKPSEIQTEMVASLAKRAENALGFVDTPMLREEARKWHEFQIDIRKRYLLPRRSS